jgi:Helix-turn-helix domain
MRTKAPAELREGASTSMLASAVDGLPPLITVPDLAAFLKVSLSHAYDLARGEGLAIFVSERNIRIDREQLRRWLEAKRSG